MINSEIKIEEQVKGTRILYGDLAALRRKIINTWVDIAIARDFQEIVLPSLEKEQIYINKVGEELVERQMYRFPDKKGRDLCLRPEGTATCQLLAQKYKYSKDVRLFYETRCWRYEQPQSGRYREFSQFGVEILNPRLDYMEELVDMATDMLSIFIPRDMLVVNTSAQRGLSYYVGDGFEIEIPDMGAQKQVVGGGSYAEGIGFAIGIDRFLSRLATISEKND